MITTPADERLITDPYSPHHVIQRRTKIRVKAWSDSPIEEVAITLGKRHSLKSKKINESICDAEGDYSSLPDGAYTLRATARDAAGKNEPDEIRAIVSQAGRFIPKHRAGRNQDNALGAWIERGILGTQLGPNKNGRKW
jgi:Icc protein